MARRPAGFGSLIEVGNRIRGTIRLNGEVRTVYGATSDEVERKLAALRAAIILPPRPARRRAPIDPRRRLVASEIVARVIREGRLSGWDDAYTATVIVASLTPRRLQLGVWGPCFYCGDWTANTVDHLNPRARGGLDNPGNLASACASCNFAKGNRTVVEFLERRQAMAR